MPSNDGRDHDYSTWPRRHYNSEIDSNYSVRRNPANQRDCHPLQEDDETSRMPPPNAFDIRSPMIRYQDHASSAEQNSRQWRESSASTDTSCKTVAYNEYPVDEQTPKQSPSSGPQSFRGQVPWNTRPSTPIAQGSLEKSLRDTQLSPQVSSHSGRSRSSTTYSQRSARSASGVSSDSRPFAAGLALPKPKVDPYDVQGLQEPTLNFLLKNSETIEPGGTWTTIDPTSGVRKHDKQYREEQREQSSRGRNGTSQTQGRSKQSTGLVGDGKQKLGGSKWSSVDNELKPFENMMENPELDVDDDIRAKYRPIEEILQAPTGPKNAYEKRNQGLGLGNPAAGIKNVIGGKVINIVQPKADQRVELLDRNGNYFDGINRGQIKKRLRKARAELIEKRDQEMVAETQKKRKWASMSEEEQEAELAEKRARKIIFPLDEEAIFEFTDIPDYYLPENSAAVRIASSNSRTVSRPSSEYDNDSLFDVGSDDFDLSQNRDFESFRNTRPKAAPPIRGRPAQRRTSKPHNSRRTSLQTASSNTLQSSLDSTSINLKPVEDVQDISFPEAISSSQQEAFNELSDECKLRGRIIIVKLHPLVQYRKLAIPKRIFGGIVQEIQYFQDQRMAIVVFAIPSEAKKFWNHVQCAKEKGGQEDRKLQLDAAWYHGSEKAAICQPQAQLIRCMTDGARRAFKIMGIPHDKTTVTFAAEMELHFGRDLVNVGLRSSPNRFKLKEEGKTGILEFDSVRAAIQAFMSIESGEILAYEGCDIEWLADPCERTETRVQGCHCSDCMSG